MAIMRIPASWGEQFYLSISNEFGYIETVPVRVFNDGTPVIMGEPLRVGDADGLILHLMEFERGNLRIWQPPEDYFDEEDVCRNGKPISECECC